MARFTSEQIHQAAEQAAVHLINNPDEWADDGIITSDRLLELSGLEPPAVYASRKEHKDWDLAWMDFREKWRDMVLKWTGRYPKTLQGTGFTLLEPDQNVQHAEDLAISGMVKAISKGRRILRHTRDGDLSDEARQAKVAAQIRLSAMRSAVNTAQDQVDKERKYREAPSPGRPTTPAAGGVPIPDYSKLG